jgi:predicted ArsR family transcriptional regulator
MNANSIEAYQSIQPHLTELQARVLSHVRAAGAHGINAYELARAADLIENTARPRLSDLRALGLIIEAGRRKNGRGRNETVFIAA